MPQDTGVTIGTPTISMPDAVRSQFWSWYNQHQEDTVMKKNVLMAKITIKVKDLQPVFVQIFGSP